MEILDYAIKMEMDGEKFYLDLAEKNKDNKLNVVFKSLANDEAHHAKIIKNKKEGKSVSLDEGAQATIENVFSGSDFEIDSSTAEQVDAYKMALEKEQESIDLYKKLLSQSDEDKELFTFLIGQEEEHYALIEEIIKHLNRPNEWVESAEFGLRREKY